MLSSVHFAGCVMAFFFFNGIITLMSPAVSGHDNRDGYAPSAITVLTYELIFLVDLYFSITLWLIFK